MELVQRQTPKQKLVLTPQLQQSFQILAMGAQQLEMYLQEQYAENPMLELYPEEADVFESFEPEEYHWRTEEDKEERLALIPQKKSPRQELIEILPLDTLTNREILCAKAIIESLDSDGYLRDEMEDIGRICGCSPKEMEKALEAVQDLDPAGIGARSLQECFLLQLERFGGVSDKERMLLEEHMEELLTGRTHYLAFLSGMTEKEVEHLAARLRMCRPKPASLEEDTAYIIPDVVVEVEQRHLEVRINETGLSRVRMNQEYLALAERDTGCEAFLRPWKKAVTELMAGLEFRKKTIFRIAEYVVEHQRAFFTEGECLRPLGIQEIARELGISESTVSRTLNEKYILCERGLFPMKALLSRRAGTPGSRISQDAIKALIGEILREEIGLTDQEIVSRLAAYQISISRRTVAKYRMQMGVTSSYYRNARA